MCAILLIYLCDGIRVILFVLEIMKIAGAGMFFVNRTRPLIHMPTG